MGMRTVIGTLEEIRGKAPTGQGADRADMRLNRFEVDQHLHLPGDRVRAFGPDGAGKRGTNRYVRQVGGR
jgi:hypothetical protein